MHGLLLLPVLLSLFGPGSCTSLSKSNHEEDDTGNKFPLTPGEKQLPYYISHPQLLLNGPFSSKNFLGSPYKAYGDDKDLGIGTSGEDSSESSSSKSQRRQAMEDENTRRRYEEGWRRSSHQNLSSSNPPAQFQPVSNIYGQESEGFWSMGHRRFYDDLDTHKQRPPYEMERDAQRYTLDNRSRPRYRQPEDQAYFEEDTNRYHRRRSSDDSRRWTGIEDRRLRRYSPPEGIYKSQNAAAYRSSSQHNLYYPRHSGLYNN